MTYEEMLEWWEWQKWRRRMNPTTTKLSPIWAKQYLKEQKEKRDDNTRTS